MKSENYSLNPLEDENISRLSLLRVHHNSKFGSFMLLLPKILGLFVAAASYYNEINILLSILIGFVSYFLIAQIKNIILISLFPISEQYKARLLKNKTSRDLLNTKDGAYSLYYAEYISQPENINNPKAYNYIRNKVGKK